MPIFQLPAVLKRSSVNAYDSPSIFCAHAFHLNYDHLKTLVYLTLSAGDVILNTNEHSPTTGTPVSSESCKNNPKHFGVANFSTP
jgi:hypothetical protein